MIGAYQLLPERIEPLHDLARYYRERGLNHAGLIFAEEGLRKPQSSPASRFVEPDIHSWGMKSEYSILANYAIDPIRKAKGFEICDELALDRNIAASPRNLARISLDKSELRNLPTNFQLMPGMPVIADVRIGERSVLSYFLEKIIPVFKEGFREP